MLRNTITFNVLVLFQFTAAVRGFLTQIDRPLQSNRVLFNSVDSAEGDDSSIQWELFNKHHAKGSWKGVWTTYDYIGDIVDETVASVDLYPESDGSVNHIHSIVVGAKKSDCATCFDSMEQKTIPVAQYSPGNLKKSRFAACSMVNGPSILRSGAMATELVLNHKDARVRVIFQHAPVWEQGVEPGSCPPQGLKLFRTMISREALRSTAPTAETEAAMPPSEGSPLFYRPVPPFKWYNKWSGTSWTWGPSAGNRGWSIEELEESDSWQGTTPVESWNLRVGSVHVQAPRVITDANAGICRLAWLPDDETLLRVEVGVMALQPMIVEDDMMVGFEQPSLSSLRCDMMKKTGELDREKVFVPSRDLNRDKNDESEKISEEASKKEEKIKAKPEITSKEETSGDEPAMRDSLSL